jgi:hypothetical protein
MYDVAQLLSHGVALSQLKRNCDLAEISWTACRKTNTDQSHNFSSMIEN